MKKILFSLSLILSFNAHAQTSGSCAPLDENDQPIGSCQWSLNGDTLTISGTGPMKDYSTLTQNGFATTDAPFNDRNSDKDTGSLYQIKNIVIENGITNIGNNFMAGALHVENLQMADSVKSIGEQSFYLSAWEVDHPTLSLSKNLESVADYGLYGWQTEIELPNTLKSLGLASLSGLQNTSIIIPDSMESISSSAFEGYSASKLTSLVLPQKLIDENGLDINALCNSKISTLYCPQGKETFCADYVNSAKTQSSCYGGSVAEDLSYETYRKEGDRYILGNQPYKSIADFYNNKPIRRIYTIEEANFVAGDKNRVSITYR